MGSSGGSVIILGREEVTESSSLSYPGTFWFMKAFLPIKGISLSLSLSTSSGNDPGLGEPTAQLEAVKAHQC